MKVCNGEINYVTFSTSAAEQQFGVVAIQVAVLKNND